VNSLFASMPWKVRFGPLVLVWACLAGCQDGPALTAGVRGTFSEVYSHFDPEAEFARLGFMVDADSEGGHLSVRYQYGWKPKQGSLQLPAGTTGCVAVAAAIRRSLDRVLDANCIDELNGRPERPRGKPLFGLLRYETDGMRGHIYVWLFPNESETRINYAILLSEELSRGCSSRTTASF
jgi:hypothetical protein